MTNPTSDRHREAAREQTGTNLHLHLLETWRRMRLSGCDRNRPSSSRTSSSRWPNQSLFLHQEQGNWKKHSGRLRMTTRNVSATAKRHKRIVVTGKAYSARCVSLVRLSAMPKPGGGVMEYSGAGRPLPSRTRERVPTHGPSSQSRDKMDQRTCRGREAAIRKSAVAERSLQFGRSAANPTESRKYSEFRSSYANRMQQIHSMITTLNRLRRPTPSQQERRAGEKCPTCPTCRSRDKSKRGTCLFRPNEEGDWAAIQHSLRFVCNSDWHNAPSAIGKKGNE